ncbi:hypothetical protein Q644_24545 [Brucella intermedia 229E]|uniref:Uncharacterized protein n=1 Tax=Brucella intermedia 229E TaxID=1337887 RepID=U4V4I7_9HYPH|nr:hypothetical protein Q644_24545 [Brucella intermedia 229E]
MYQSSARPKSPVELEIDEYGNTGFDSAGGAVAFGRNQSRRGCKNESPFDFIEILAFILFEWNRGGSLRFRFC